MREIRENYRKYQVYFDFTSKTQQIDEELLCAFEQYFEHTKREYEEIGKLFDNVSQTSVVTLHDVKLRIDSKQLNV